MMSIDRRFAWPKLRFALLPILGVLAAAPAAADYYEGLTAYERQDYALALSESEPLAQAGDARAQLLLGRMYTAGQGTLQDFVRAHMWFNLAASAGAPEAAAAREAIAQRMTPDQIAEAQRLAAVWRPQPAAGPAPGAPPPTQAPAWQAAGLDRAQIADLQWQLALHGYDPGVADGAAGRRTVAAIRRYQADAGLPPDGQPSAALLDHLRYTTPAVRNAAAGSAAPPVVRAAPAAAPAFLAPYDDMARAYVVGVQQELLSRGYDPGPADGVPGRRTRAAIRRFQADVGLPVDGEVSHALLNHLKFVTAPAVY